MRELQKRGINWNLTIDFWGLYLQNWTANQECLAAIFCPVLVCPQKAISSSSRHKYILKEFRTATLYSETHLFFCFNSLFWPKKVHFKEKIDSFLTFMLINFLVLKLKFCICFGHENIIKPLENSKISACSLTCPKGSFSAEIYSVSILKIQPLSLAILSPFPVIFLQTT